MRIVCLGAVNQDVKARVSSPVIMGTSNPGHVDRSVGGVAANIARNLARLEMPVTLASAVGDDTVGRAMLGSLRADGVDTAGVTVVTGGRTGSYVAVLDDEGELAAAVADVEILDGLEPAWATRTAGALTDADVWVIETNLPEAVIGAVLDLRPSGVTVVADPVSVPKAGRLLRHLERIDVLLPAVTEGAALVGIEDARGRVTDVAVRLADLGVGTVLLKLGAGGVLVVTRHRTELVPAIPPDHVTDVTGAGDAMAAGYLYGLAIAAADPVRYGLAAASLTVERGETVAPGMSVDAVEARHARGRRASL